MSKRIILLMAVLVAALSCRQAEDSRYFAPEVVFGQASYTVQAEEGGLDIVLQFSRPAQTAFTIKFNVTSSLQEDVQYRVSSNILNVAVGDTEARIHIDLVNDEIWDENSWIDLTLLPGIRYTLNPEKGASVRVNVSKAIQLPILQLEGEAWETNPFLAESASFRIVANRAPRETILVDLAVGDLVPGEDFLVDGKASARLEMPAGVMELPFVLEIVKKDLSGYDKQVELGLENKKGVYVASSETVSLHLYDPVVNLKPLWKTAALNGGTGYRWNQALLMPDGTWEGNNTVDFWVSAEGSNYVGNQRSLWIHTSFGCPATASPSHVFRLVDLVPLIRHPNAETILDYGANESYRSFFPCDSLFRFVPDRLDDDSKGSLVMPSPRTIYAYIGDRVAWGDAWKKDADITGGDMAKSTFPLSLFKVTLEKLEGRYDLTSKDAALLLTAWFSCEDERFMKADTENGKDPASTYAIQQEDGLWRVEYKIWPR